MQCLLEILHSSTFYIAQADLPQGAISSKTHFGVNCLLDSVSVLVSLEVLDEDDDLHGDGLVGISCMAFFYLHHFFDLVESQIESENDHLRLFPNHDVNFHFHTMQILIGLV